MGIGEDLIVVKTSNATYRLKKKTAPLNAAPGNTVMLWVTSGHAVIDHHRQDTGRRHSFITGPLLDSASQQQITLWTPEEERTFSLIHLCKADDLQKGRPITLELSAAGSVLDFW